MRISETFAAGVPKRYVIQGNFLRVQSLSGLTSGSLGVELFRNGQKLNIDLTGVDAGDWARSPDTFDAIQVTSSVAQIVTLQVNLGDVGSDRIVGVVSIVDGAKSRSLVGVAFYGGQGASAGPALYPTIQLWNPAASGFNLVVEQLWCSLQDTVPGNLVFAHNAVALSGGGSAAFSKKLGAAASVGFIRYENLAAFPTATAFSFMYTNPGAVLPFSFREPIIVPPGVGLLVLGPVNTGCYVNFEFFQEGI